VRQNLGGYAAVSRHELILRQGQDQARCFQHPLARKPYRAERANTRRSVRVVIYINPRFYSSALIVPETVPLNGVPLPVWSLDMGSPPEIVDPLPPTPDVTSRGGS
jgi:hypothetical protein